METPDFPLKLRPQEVNDRVQDGGDLQNFSLLLLLLLIGREWGWTCCGLCQALFCHVILFKVTFRWFLNLWRSGHMNRSSSCEEHEPDRTWCPSCQHTWHVAFAIHAWRRRKTRQRWRNDAPARKLDPLAAVRVQHSHCCCLHCRLMLVPGQQHGCKKKLHNTDGARPPTDRRHPLVENRATWQHKASGYFKIAAFLLLK